MEEINEFLKVENQVDQLNGKSAIAGFVMAYLKSFSSVMQQEGVIQVYSDPRIDQESIIEIEVRNFTKES
jgi:hypothetical protein